MPTVLNMDNRTVVVVVKATNSIRKQKTKQKMEGSQIKYKLNQCFQCERACKSQT